MEAQIDQWASTVVLGDGDTALIRPITPDDKQALLEFHERQSTESKYSRFFSPKPTLSAKELAHFTEVDFVDRAALVVERRDAFIGWGSYERWRHRPDAEAAFMVDDDHHGKGIATLLLEHLAAIARSNGIAHFTAQTLGENRSMLAVFTKAGWPLHRRFESGVVDIDFDLSDTAEFLASVERREQRADSRSVARLLLPQSIAVIGASDRLGSVGRELWRNATHGFRGPMYPVNPHHRSVGGVQAYATVDDIAGDVGLAVVAVPPSALAETIDQCIAKHVRGAVVVTAVDNTGIDVDGLISHARRNGIRIIGPASMGFASPRADVLIQVGLVHVDLPSGNVAFSMQSGSLAGSLLGLARKLQLGTSWFVSLGDKSDVSANDLLQFWEDDDATRVIALYTESLGNPRKFARIARRVSAKRPIVAVRTGAALVGPGTGAMYTQSGLIEVPTVATLLDTARVFSSEPLMNGRRVAVLSNSRSPAVLAVATLQAAGLEVTESPIQLEWRSTSVDYAAAIEDALTDDLIDAVLVIHAPPVVAAVGEPIPAIDRAAASRTKPLLAVMLGSTDGPLRDGSTIPAFEFPEAAAAVLGRLATYSEWRATEATEPDPEPQVDPVGAGSIITRALGNDPSDPAVVATLLGAYGVTMSPSRWVPAADAVEVAAELGYPVAVKAAVRRAGRSTEAGVALDLSEAADVTEAVDIMLQHLGDDAAIVNVQKMVPPGLDLRVRIAADDQLGPVISVGLGGAQADLIGDESSRLVPISTATARAMLADTRAAKGLDEHASMAMADVITRVALLASDHVEIIELDLNPVIVSDGGAFVTDATLRLEPRRRAESALRRLE